MTAFTLLAVLLAVAPAARADKACAKAVVLDFPMRERLVEWRDECRNPQEASKPVETEKAIRGWWFGSNDIYYNANVGRLAADVISDQLRESGTYQVYSRENLKYYYADKKDILREKFPDMSDKDVNAAMLKLDPIEIGKELGVDKVVVGMIGDSEMRHSRAWGYFNSTMTFRVAVLDVKTKTFEFDQPYGGSKGRHSQYTALEEFAVLVVKDIQKTMATGIRPNPRIMQREP